MKKFVYAILVFAPVLASAQTVFTNITNLVNAIGGIVKLVIPIIFGLAIVYFFWGLVEYIRSAGDPKKASEGKSIMIYGIIAIAVMGSIYGLVSWLQTTTGVTSNTAITPPLVPGL